MEKSVEEYVKRLTAGYIKFYEIPIDVLMEHPEIVRNTIKKKRI